MINKFERGFTFVELLVAIGLVAIFVPALIKSLSFSLFATHQGEQFSQAYALAQEAMEAIYTIKSEGGTQWDWTTTPVNTSAGSYYQPSIQAGTWQLGGILTVSPPPITQAPFTRTVVIEEVERCSTLDPLIFDICSGGIADTYTRKITVQVTWQEPSGDQEVETEAYVTAH